MTAIVALVVIIAVLGPPLLRLDAQLSQVRQPSDPISPPSGSESPSTPKPPVVPSYSIDLPLPALSFP